jgi:hypothetical protein
MQADEQDALAGREKCHGDANWGFTIERDMSSLTFQVRAGFTLSGLHGKTDEVLNLESVARGSGDFPPRAVFAG